MKITTFWVAAGQLKLHEINFYLPFTKRGWSYLQNKTKTRPLYKLYERGGRPVKIGNFRRRRL